MTITARIKRELLTFTKRILRRIFSNLQARRHISGNGIAKICNMSVNDLNNISEVDIREAASIFVKSDNLISFLEEYSGIVSEKTIISGNGDTNFDTELDLFKIPKRLFLQNLGFEPSVKSIQLLPIGLENYEHLRSGFSFLHKPLKNQRVEQKILVPPMSPSNSVRKRVLDDLELADKELFQIETEFRSVLNYFKLTKDFKFVLVCEGNGHDTHRLWEVLYQNSFPVLLNTPFSQNIKKMGFPVLIINSIIEVNKDILEAHLLENSLSTPTEIIQLWLPYWEREILGP